MVLLIALFAVLYLLLHRKRMGLVLMSSVFLLSVPVLADHTVTFHAGDGVFEDETTENVVTYGSVEVTKYSHTSNISDTGTRNGNYANYLATKDIVQIQGATSLHVKVTYGTENSWDMLYIFAGQYTGSVTSNMAQSTGYLYKLTGGYNTPTTIEYDIPGDTVTFGFYSDSSSSYYGYYAVITSNEIQITDGIYKEPQHPNTEYEFIGWFDENDKEIDIDSIDEETEVFAKYKYIYDYDGIEWRFNSDTGELKLGKGETQVLEAKERSKKDYPWDSFRSEIKKVTTDGNLKMNGCLKEMFTDCTSLESADISWDMTNVTDTSQIFENCLSLSEITIGEKTFISNSGLIGKWEKDGIKFSPDELIANGSGTYHFAQCYAVLYDDGSLVIQDSDETNGLVTQIWNQIDLKEINKSKDVPWYQYRENIKTVSVNTDCIPLDVDYWFYEMSNCTEMDLALLDTRNNSTTTKMFLGCNNLTKITLGENFSFIGDLNRSDQAILPGNYYKKDNVRISAEKLRNTYQPSMAGTYVKDEFWAILYEDGEMVIQYGDTADDRNVIDKWCEFETTKFNNVSNVPWQGKVNLIKKVTVKDEIAPLYTAFWFDGMIKCTEMNLDKLDTTSTLDLKNMFSNCQILENVVLGKKFSFKGKTSSLLGESALLPNEYWKKEGSEKIKNTDLCDTYNSSMSGTYIRENDICVILYGNGELIFQNGFDYESENIITQWICNPNLTNASEWSNQKDLITKVIIKDYLKPESIKYWFYNLDHCIEMDLTNLDVSNITDFSNVFYNCSSLNSLDLSNWDMSKMLSMANIFTNCNRLTEVTLGTSFRFKEVTSALPGNYWKTRNNERILSTDLYNTYTSDMAGTYVRDDYLAILYDDGEFVIQYGTETDGRNVNQMWSGFETGTTIPWESFKSQIKKVNIKECFIPSSINNWFNGMSNCSEMNLKNLNTSNISNMDYIFKDCTSLISLNLSDFDTSNVTSMSHMFDNCNALINLNLSSFNTSSVTDMSSMFFNCKNLINLDLLSFDTSNVTNMNRMFSECNSFSGLNLSNLNTQSVIDMSYMFHNCKNLTNLDLSNLNTQNVTDMSYMFYYCYNLISLNVSGIFNTSNVTNMKYMFYDCYNLPSLNLSGFNTSKVTDMSDMFEECRNLKSLDLSNFDVSIVKYMDSMFCNCVALTDLNISSFNTQSSESMIRMFYHCNKLTNLDLSSLNTFNVTRMDNMFSYCDSLSEVKLGTLFSFKGKNITNTDYMAILPGLKWKKDDLIISNTDLRDSYISDMAGTYYRQGIYVILYDDNELVFQNDENTDERNIKEKWVINGTESSNYPWNTYSNQITKVTVKDEITPVTTNGWFYGLSKCTQMDLLKLNISNVQSLENMFYNCSAINRLDLSTWDVSNVQSMYYMFYNCSNLKELDISSWNPVKLTNVYNMFNGVSKLRKITVGYSNIFKGNDISSSSRILLPGSSWSHDDSIYTPSELRNADAIETGEYIRNTIWATLYDDGELVFQNDVLDERKEIGNWIDFADYSYTPPNIPWRTYLNKIKKISIANDISPKYTVNWFDSCQYCTEMDLTKLNTSNVLSMNSMFAMCNNLVKVKLGADFSFKGNNITNVNNWALLPGSYWKKDERISSTDLRNDYTAEMAGTYYRDDIETNISPDTEKIVILYSDGELKFMNTENADLTDSNIIQMWTGFDTTTYTSASQIPWYTYRYYVNKVNVINELKPVSIAYWFSDMINCDDFILQQLDTSEVTNMSYTFNNCSSVKQLNISGFNTGNVTDMTEIFSGCSNLNEIVLGEDFSFKGGSITNENKMAILPGEFWKNEDGLRISCKNIRDTYTANMAGKYVSNSAYAIIYTDGEMVFQMGNETDGRTTYGIWTGFETHVIYNNLWRDYSSKVEKVTVKNVIAPISTAYWFNDFKNCTMMDVGNLDVSNVTNMKGMFCFCSKLQIIKGVSNWNTSNVTDMSNMFYENDRLDNIAALSNLNTSNVVNMDNMFYSCDYLKNINGALNWDTSKVTNMSYMFYGCKNLAYIYGVCNWNTSNVTNMESMFSNCTNLQNIDGALNWNTSNVTDMSYMFCKCTYLQSIDGVCNWNTSNVTNMKSMFNYCQRLQKIDALLNWNISNVTNMSYMFYYCQSLQDINSVSNWNTSNVTDMSYMFYYCQSLQDIVTLSNWNVLNVTDMQSMFACNYKVIKIDIFGWNTKCVINMRDMFRNCSELFEIKIGPNFSFKGGGITNTSNMAILPATYWKREGYTSITNEELRDTYDKNMAGTYYRDESCAILYEDGEMVFQNSLISDGRTIIGYWVEFKDINGFAKDIPWHSFATSVKKVTVKDALSPIKTHYWFDGFINCTSMDLEKLNTSNVTDMYGMFSNCSSLTHLDLSNFDTSNVTNISAIFSECTSLEILDISNFNTNSVTSSANFMNNCKILRCISIGENFSFTKTNLTLPGKYWKRLNGDRILATELRNTYNAEMAGTYYRDNYWCIIYSDGEASLQNTNQTDGRTVLFKFQINESNSISKYKYYVLSLIVKDEINYDYQYFRSLSNCESFDLNKLNTSNVTDFSSMFESCSSVKELDLTSFNTEHVTNMSYMFNGCSSLESVLLNSFDTSSITSTSYMFQNCSSLRIIDLSNFATFNASVTDMFFNSGITQITLGSEFSFKGNTTNSGYWATLPGNNWRNTATGTSYTSSTLRSSYNADMAGTYVLDDMYVKLYTDGTLAIMPTSASTGSVKQSWTLSGSLTNASASSVAWNTYRNDVKKVVVGSVYPTDVSYWFMSMPNCTEIDLNLLNTSTTTKLKDMFTGNGVQQITIGKQFSFKGITDDQSEWAILPSGKWKSDKGTYSSAALQERPIAGIYIFDQGACAILYSDGQLVIQGTTNGDGRDILATWKNIDETDQPWSSYQSDIKEIHVNRDAIPSAGWFKDLTNCKEIHALKLDFTGELSHMFEGCTNLEELEADFTNTTATDTSYMFAGCGLEVIDVSGLSAPLTNAEGMFSDCPNLVTVLMYDMDTRNANVKNLFYGSDIKEIEIGPNVRFTGTDDPAELPGEYWKRTRVRGNNRISSDDLQNFDGTRGGTYERDDRYAYINGSTLVFTADKHEWTGFETTDSIPWDSSRTGITAVEFQADVHPITIAHWFENLAISEIDLSNLDLENTDDYTEAFKGSRIRSINLGGQPTRMPSVFENCDLLTTITGLNTTNATDMSGLFRNCTSLSTLDMTDIKTDNATNLSGMFEGTGLTTLDLSGFDTLKATDMSAMFREAQVETLDISGFTTEQANVSNMFTGCHFSSVKLGDTFNFNGTGDATILPTPPKENGHNGKWTDGTNDYSPKALRALYDSTPTTTTWVWADDTNAYVEFDANGGTFLDGSTSKTVSSSNRYSYTSNMDSSGIPWSGYGNNVDTEDIITIPNADNLIVELTYETEDNDSLYIKENNTTYSGTRKTETINIDGNTVTFVFHSDASIDNHFGYLAKVTGMKDGEPVQLTETNAPSEPIRPGYMFDGWNTMADGTGDTKEVIPFTAGNTTTVYAKWTKDDRVTLTILHKKENLDGSWYTADTDSYKVWPDTETTPSTKTYTGFHTPDSQTITITEDSELEYQYKAEKYTIKFLSNGAEGTMNDAVMKIPYVQPLPSCTYKKEGSIFMGWDLNGTTYSDRQVVRLGHDGDVVSLTAIWLDNDTPAVEVKNGEIPLKLRPGQTAVVPLSAHIDYNIEEAETEGWKSESKNTAGTIPAGKDEQATITNTRIVDPLTFKVHGSFIPADNETGKFLLSFDGDAVYELSAGDTMLFGEVLPFEVTMDGTADMGREYDKNAHIGGTKTTNGMETFEGTSDRITVDAPATVVIKGTPMGAEAESTKTEESETADIVFDLPAFTRPGTYHMTMRQVAGNDDRIIYDNQTVDITVTVTDDGKLTAEQDTIPVFTNSLKDVKLSITNTVTNTTKDSTFYFIVNATRDGEPINTNGFTDGKLRIGLKGNETKDIDIPYGVDYTVTQEDHPGFVLVSSERTNGKMVENIEATFENTRVLSSEFDPYVITELIGGEGVMAFELRDKDGNVIDTAESTGGRVIFKPIPYTGEGEYTYYVTGLEGTDRVAYDTHTEAIQVIVREGEGLEVTATYEKDDHASFVSRAIHDLVIKNTNNGPDNGFEYTLSLKNPDGTETNDTFTLKNNENKPYELLSGTEWTITQTAKDGFTTTVNENITNTATGTIMFDTEVQYNNNFAAEVYISVVDENNNPLSGVQVRVNSDHDEWTTDGTQHTTGGLVPGNYTIETTVPTGYEPVSDTFTVNDNGTIEDHTDGTIILTVPYSLHDVPIRTVDERNQHIEAKVTAGETVINKTTADTFISVKPGTYTATQDKVTGYECPAPIEFTVAIDGTITVYNETVTEIKLINTREEYTLTFTLNLEGNMADNTKMFGFTMETNDAGSISQETFELDNGSNKTFTLPYGATYTITPEQNEYTYNKNTVEGMVTGNKDESITATLNKGIDTGRATSTAGILIVLMSIMIVLYTVNERKRRKE